MNSPRTLLSCILIASIPLLASGPSWGKPTQDKSATKVTAKQAKTKARKSKVVAKKARLAPSKAAVAAVATVPVAVLATSQEAIQHEPATAAVPAANPYQAFQQQSVPPASANPYLAYQQQVAPIAATQPTQSAPTASTNAYVATPQHLEPVNPWGNFGQVANNVKQFLPHLPGQDGRSILPSIKTVYPTGEKPLVVLTFKCPTELIGITPPPVKLLREGVNLAMDGINRTDLLSFNMQQVCQ